MSRLNTDSMTLVVVDVQGKLATLMHEREAFFGNVATMIRGAQILEIPVLFNEQLPDKLGETIPEIRELLVGQEPFTKSVFSCCGNPAFVSALDALGRPQVLMVGMESHVCVYQTAIDLLDAGREVHVVADAVSSRTAANRRIGLDKMAKAGAEITSVETALFELMRVAGDDRFKQIVKMFK